MKEGTSRCRDIPDIIYNISNTEMK
jgi:hypothetical protein